MFGVHIVVPSAVRLYSAEISQGSGPLPGLMLVFTVLEDAACLVITDKFSTFLYLGRS